MFEVRYHTRGGSEHPHVLGVSRDCSEFGVYLFPNLKSKMYCEKEAFSEKAVSIPRSSCV